MYNICVKIIKQQVLSCQSAFLRSEFNIIQQIVFTSPHRDERSEDRDLSSGTAASIFNTATANTCTSAAGESVRHESEKPPVSMCMCSTVAGIFVNASLRRASHLIRTMTG